MAIDRLELEDEKFNFDLKKSKEKNEEKLNEEKLDDVVFDSNVKIDHVADMVEIKKDYEITKRENARKMEKLKVESLVLKLIHEKEMKKLEKVESKIKEQTYEEVEKLRIENDKKNKRVGKSG